MASTNLLMSLSAIGFSLEGLADEDHLLSHGGTPCFMMPCCSEDPVSVSIAS